MKTGTGVNKFRKSNSAMTGWTGRIINFSKIRENQNTVTKLKNIKF